MFLIHGTADDNVPFVWSAQSVAEIPGVRLVTVEDGTHATTIALPEAIEAVREFLIEP